MNKVFLSNIKYLEKNPLHRKIVKALHEKTQQEIDSEINIVKAKKNGLSISYFNKSLLSTYDPVKDAERKLRNIECKNKEFGIIFEIYGMGMGYEISHLSKKYGEKAYFFVCEFDICLFSVILQFVDLSDIFNASKFTILVENFECLNTAEFELDIFLYKQKETVYTGNYSKVFTENIKNMQTTLSKALHFISMNTYTDILDTEIKYKNSWTNFKRLLTDRSADVLFNKFKNIPGILVSAGPSLDKNVTFLRHLQHYALIIACDSAYYNLMHHDIVPHFIITSDPSIYTQRYFVDYYENDRSFIIYEPMVNPSIFKYNKNKGFVISYNNHLLALIKEITSQVSMINAWGSISCAGLLLLAKFGSNPIITIGQDCCFYNEQTHCNFYPDLILQALNAQSHTDFLAKKSSIFDSIKKISPPHAKDCFGNTVYTQNSLMSYLENLKQIISELGNDIDFFNATEGGLLPNHCRLEDIADIITQENNPVDIFDHIESIYIASNSIIYDKEKLITLKYFISNMNVEINLDVFEDAFSTYNSIKNQFSKGGLQLFAPFIRNILLKVLKFENTSKKEIENSIKSVISDTSKFFGLIINNSLM